MKDLIFAALATGLPSAIGIFVLLTFFGLL